MARPLFQPVPQRPLGAERCTQVTVAVTALSLPQTLLRNPSFEQRVGFHVSHPGHNKGSPRLSLQCFGGQSIGAASSQPLSTRGIMTGPVPVLPNPPGPRSLTRLRHPRSWPLPEALRKGCSPSRRTPDPGRASPPGAGTASCARGKLSLFPSRVSTLASGRAVSGAKRRMPDSSPLRGVPDTARIASGERGGQIHDPGVKLGRSGNSSVDYAFARLHLFVERLRHGEEIRHALHRRRCLPPQYSRPSANLQISNVTIRVKHRYANQGPKHPAQECRVLAVICKQLSPRQPGFASLTTKGLDQQPQRVRTQHPSLPRVFSGRVSHGIWPAGCPVLGGVACKRNLGCDWFAPHVPRTQGVARRLKGVWPPLLGSAARRAAPGSRRADMPRYAQLVMGPAGSGKVRIWRKQEGRVGARGRQGGSRPEEGAGGCLHWGP